MFQKCVNMDIMDNNNNEETQTEVREFMQKTLSTRETQDEFDKFFEIISPSLKVKVQNHIFSVKIMMNPIVNKIMVVLMVK